MEIEELAEAHSKMLDSYQKATANAQKQFEDMVTKAQADLGKLVASANAQVQEAPKPAKPAAQWITADDGEQLLLLNKPAADFFSVIFDQMISVVSELAKVASK